jgi:hypothetical protein
VAWWFHARLGGAARSSGASARGGSGGPAGQATSSFFLNSVGEPWLVPWRAGCKAGASGRGLMDHLEGFDPGSE